MTKNKDDQKHVFLEMERGYHTRTLYISDWTREGKKSVCESLNDFSSMPLSISDRTFRNRQGEKRWEKIETEHRKERMKVYNIHFFSFMWDNTASPFLYVFFGGKNWALCLRRYRVPLIYPIAVIVTCEYKRKVIIIIVNGEAKEVWRRKKNVL